MLRVKTETINIDNLCVAVCAALKSCSIVLNSRRT